MSMNDSIEFDIRYPFSDVLFLGQLSRGDI